jgi:hypothetical protein
MRDDAMVDGTTRGIAVVQIRAHVVTVVIAMAVAKVAAG